MKGLRAQFGSIIRASEVCVICSDRPATTKEDVPPQSLFLEVPREYLRVPACYQCNNSTKLEDEYLRHVMTGCAWTPEGREMWRRKVKPKLRSRPGTRIGLSRDLITIPLALPNLGTVPHPGLRVDANRIQVSLRKMVWGLYWFHTGRLLQPHEPMKITFHDIRTASTILESPEVEALFRQTAAGVYRNPDVIRTFFYTGRIMPERSVWFFFFYRQVVIAAFTGDVSESAATLSD